MNTANDDKQFAKIRAESDRRASEEAADVKADLMKRMRAMFARMQAEGKLPPTMTFADYMKRCDPQPEL